MSAAGTNPNFPSGVRAVSVAGVQGPSVTGIARAMGTVAVAVAGIRLSDSIKVQTTSSLSSIGLVDVAPWMPIK